MEVDSAKLVEIFQRYPDVQAVYLFGSHAEGRARPDSDLDLAILPRHSALRERRLDILADLAEKGFCNVDLVFLDTDDIILKYQAVRLNQVVYHAPDFERGSVYSRIVREYLDFQPFLAVQHEAYKRRILDGQTRSDQRRLQKLDEYLDILRRLSQYELDEFLSDPEHYGSAERFLQLAIEVCNDLGNHVIAALNLGPVDSYADIPALLAEKGYIDEDLKRRWVRMVGFRSILVHDYLQVDRNILFDLKERSERFRALATSICAVPMSAQRDHPQGPGNMPRPRGAEGATAGRWADIRHYRC
ncbi:MAG: DUF86 domain-containing protein [Anaerolineae bacterium]|nr:DUF86 domain-containing protein [Candidatus Roseilinea sp.]MDW8449449.1 DUF86 domain-containing protein [Anaerolineae bacterium]